jgi:hypothetical protein
VDINPICVDTLIEDNGEAACRGVGAEVIDSQAKILRNGLQLVASSTWLTVDRSFYLGRFRRPGEI